MSVNLINIKIKPIYRIAWRSKITGSSGFSEWSNNLITLQQTMKEESDKFPQIDHWIECSDSLIHPDQPPSLHPQDPPQHTD